MAFEQRDNSGSIFRNEKKETENHPDLQGQAKIDGVEYWVSGWSKRTKNGDKWLSLSFKRKDQKDAKPAKPLDPHPFTAEESEDLPF